jgi:hypothetical protein
VATITVMSAQKDFERILPLLPEVGLTRSGCRLHGLSESWPVASPFPLSSLTAESG